MMPTELLAGITALAWLSATASAKGLSCLDPSGRPVEWWVVYKLPVIPESTDAALQAGLGYAYFDVSSSTALAATDATAGAGLKTVNGARLNRGK